MQMRWHSYLIYNVGRRILKQKKELFRSSFIDEILLRRVTNCCCNIVWNANIHDTWILRKNSMGQFVSYVANKINTVQKYVGKCWVRDNIPCELFNYLFVNRCKYISTLSICIKLITCVGKGHIEISLKH